MFCDINHIKRLNGWDDDQISGFEIFIDDFDELDRMTLAHAMPWAIVSPKRRRAIKSPT